MLEIMIVLKYIINTCFPRFLYTMLMVTVLVAGPALKSTKAAPVGKPTSTRDTAIGRAGGTYV